MATRKTHLYLLTTVLLFPSFLLAQIHERKSIAYTVSQEKNSDSIPVSSHDHESCGEFELMGNIHLTDSTQEHSFFALDVDEDHPFSNSEQAAESEDEILYASFDNHTIHYPRFDYTKLKDSITIPLLDSLKNERFVHPMPARITSNFGPRRRRYHYGIDLKLYTGDSVFCAFDGIVRIARFNPSYGNLVVIRHHNGLETYYAHLSKLLVKNNQEIKAGAVLGLGGNTGRSRGSHLHLEIRYLGAAINPEHIIDFTDFSLKSDTLILTRDSFRYRHPQGASNSYAKGPIQGQYYTVRRGDTLSGISSRTGTSVKRLAQINGIQGSKIRAGQKIRVR